MLLTPRINQCTNCESLRELLNQVDCSLTNLFRNKLNNENYNVSMYFCMNEVKELSHYRRILTKKIYNSNYLRGICEQDIINQVTKLLFGDCGNCIQCDEDTTTTTSSSSSTITSTMTLTTTNA